MIAAKIAAAELSVLLVEAGGDIEDDPDNYVPGQQVLPFTYDELTCSANAPSEVSQSRNLGAWMATGNITQRPRKGSVEGRSHIPAELEWGAARASHLPPSLPMN